MSTMCTDDCDVLAGEHTRECWHKVYSETLELRARCKQQASDLTDYHHEVYCLVLRELVGVGLKRSGISEDTAPEDVAIARKYADLSYPPEPTS